MQIPPASILATWPTPNYVDPVRRYHAVVIMNLVFYPIVLLIMILRIFTRCFVSKSFGADDYLIIAAMFPTTAFGIVALLSELHYHLDRHVWDVPPATLVVGLKLVLTSQIIFTAAQSFIKLSMLTLIYRIMASTSDRMRMLTKWIMVLVTVDALVFIVVVLFQCRTPSDYWTLSVEPQKCINQSLHVLIASILNTITDFLIVLFPIPTILKLKLPRKQSAIVILLFSGGFIVCIAGGIRTYYTYMALISWDPTWDQYPNGISSSVELYVGVICASIPSTKPFFQRYLPKLIDSASWSRMVFSSNKGKSVSTGLRSTTIIHASTDLELGNIKGPFQRLDKSTAKLGNITENNDDECDTSISSFHTGNNGMKSPRLSFEKTLTMGNTEDGPYRVGSPESIALHDEQTGHWSALGRS